MRQLVVFCTVLATFVLLAVPFHAQDVSCEINLVQVTRLLTEAENAQRSGDTQRALQLLGDARAAIETIENRCGANQGSLDTAGSVDFPGAFESSGDLSSGSGSIGITGDPVEPSVFVDDMDFDTELTITNDYFSRDGDETFTFQYPGDWTVQTYPSGLVTIVNDASLIDNNPLRNSSLSLLPDQAVVEFLFQDAADYGFDANSLMNPNFVDVISSEFVFGEEPTDQGVFQLRDKNVAMRYYEREDGSVYTVYIFDLPEAPTDTAFGILFTLDGTDSTRARSLPFGLIDTIRFLN